MVSALQKPCANAARRCGGFRHLVAYASLGNTATSKHRDQGLCAVEFAFLSTGDVMPLLCVLHKQEFHKWRFITQQ